MEDFFILGNVDKSSLVSQNYVAKEYGYEDKGGEEDGPDLRDNLMKLQVYFNTLNIEVISEYPTYKVRTLAGKMGHFVTGGFNQGLFMLMTFCILDRGRLHHLGDGRRLQPLPGHLDRHGVRDPGARLRPLLQRVREAPVLRGRPRGQGQEEPQHLRGGHDEAEQVLTQEKPLQKATYNKHENSTCMISKVGHTSSTSALKRKQAYNKCHGESEYLLPYVP